MLWKEEEEEEEEVNGAKNVNPIPIYSPLSR